MSELEAISDLDALTLGHGVRLADLVDRGALNELAHSFFTLFGIPLRIIADDGAVLADAVHEQELCRYLNTLGGGRAACVKTVSLVKRLQPEGVAIAHPCFTGAKYHVVPIEYDHRRLGRAILGPYLPSAVVEPPASLLTVDPGVSEEAVRELLPLMPRAPEDRVEHIATHLRASLDLILFAGHKALLTSQMHLLAVTESYRELSEKNQSLEEAVERLRELDRLKSNFLATVSHELRTPLTSIIGYSEMLSEGIAGEMTAEQTDFVRTIREKGEQLLSLIMSLLDLSKLESGTMRLLREETRIAMVLGEVVSTLMPTARKKGVALTSEATADIPTLVADPEKLRQVLLNLTENAIKFTPAGGTVHLAARAIEGIGDDDEDGFILVSPTQRKIEVRVSDSGIGIPAASMSRVFDAFYQVDSSSTREYGGTGLGLSIVKRLVEAHGGTIEIEANQPKGTVFVVTLPLGGA